MILLSVKAGLRAAEIAALTWPMVTDSGGQIGRMIELPANLCEVWIGPSHTPP